MTVLVALPASMHRWHPLCTADTCMHIHLRVDTMRRHAHATAAAVPAMLRLLLHLAARVIISTLHSGHSRYTLSIGLEPILHRAHRRHPAGTALMIGMRVAPRHIPLECTACSPATVVVAQTLVPTGLHCSEGHTA